MKKQNAFTLVELLGILTILSIILIVAIPTITGTLKRNKERQYKEYETTLKMAAERYISDNIDSYNILNNNTGDASATYISVTNLIRGGYLDKCLKNPLSGVETCDKIYIKVTRDENSILNYDVIESDTDNALIDVTFDANGGEVSTQSKLVMVGNKYGALPTPTRPGYTFKGWNGKNYFDVNKKTLVTAGVTVDSNDWITINTATGARWYNFFTNNLDISDNTTYTFAVEFGNMSNVTDYLAVTSQTNLATQFISKTYNNLISRANTIEVFDLVSRSDATSDVGLRTFYSNASNNTNESLTFRISVMDQDSTVSSSNFKYEPYYITSNTTVVQSSNHTLKAIWQKN